MGKTQTTIMKSKQHWHWGDSEKKCCFLKACTPSFPKSNSRKILKIYVTDDSSPSKKWQTDGDSFIEGKSRKLVQKRFASD